MITTSGYPLTALAAQLTRLAPETPMTATLDALSRDPRALHLAATLALDNGKVSDAGTRLVLCVFQFEEVFTLCRDEAERASFIENLLYAASVPDGRVVVVLTMRADFYSRCAAYPDLAARVASHQYLVSPMDEAGLRAAIAEPAWKVGLDFEDGLIETILEDVENQPGSLPLLEHALLELWRRRRGRLLTLEGYQATGGVSGAIAQRADELYSGFSPEQQAIARRVMLRLTQPGEVTEETRRRATLAELVTSEAERPTLEAVIAELVEARLLTTSTDDSGATWVDVAHEALIRGWPRLRGWIDEDREGLLVHRRITEAAQEWARLDRDEGVLFRGARLAEAVEFADARRDGLNDVERAFLQAGVELRQREEVERERQRAARERLQRRAAAVLLVAFLSASVLALFAWDQRGDARSGRREAAAGRAAEATRAAEAEAARQTAESRRAEAEAAQAVAATQQAAAQAAQATARCGSTARTGKSGSTPS